MQRWITGLRRGVYSAPSRWCPRALAHRHQDASSLIASTPALPPSAVGSFHLLLPNIFSASLPRLCPSTIAEYTPVITSAPGKSNQHLNRHSGSWTMQSYYCTAAFQPVRMLGIGWAGGQVLALRQPVSSSSHPISSSQPQAHKLQPSSCRRERPAHKLQPSSCGRERPPLLIHQPRAAERLGLSASQNQPIRRLIRQPNRAFACVTTKCIDTTKMEENSTKEVVTDMSEHVWFQPVFENSTHRDGAIYENTLLSKEWFDFDFTDRNETRLEPMMLSKKTKACVYYQGFCRFHFPTDILQFFSLTLAKSPVSSGSIQLYGYIAVRDKRDCLLNYVFNRSRDDPVHVQQGSLIEMTGPKRAIEMGCFLLVEFDMRIKNGEQEEGDLQLIDGAMACNNLKPCNPIKHRITGKCGIVDMSLASIEQAVEATIEIVVLEVQKCFSLSLSSYIYVMDDYHEIPLFHGTIDQSHGLTRFVVAVMLETDMLLKFKLGDDVIRYRTFKAKQHGCASRRIKLEFASFVMKVTWSTI